MTNQTTAILPVMPKPISIIAPTECPIDTAAQLQASAASILTDAAVEDDNEHPKSSPLYFPPSDPFESEDENEVPSASMDVSEPHYSERGTVAAVTSARKTKYSSQKKSGTNISKPSRAIPKKQAIAMGKRVFLERKIVKYCI